MLKVEAIGRLTADPKFRYTPSSKAVCMIRLACDVGQEKAEFIDVIAWEKLAETLHNNLKKGRLIYLEGRLQQREYERNGGGKGSVTEVIAQNVRFLDYVKKEEAPPPES